EVVKEYMQKAKAFIFAAEEDFGIAPVEAQACGTPVIAFGKGGTLETVIDGTTGIFFKEQTPESLIEAIKSFEKKENKFNSQVIRKHAEKFSKERFKKEFKQFVETKIEEFFK
ncbi:MAG: glycosyltransferase, partial [Nautiliaceae bacterium]